MNSKYNVGDKFEMEFGDIFEITEVKDDASKGICYWLRLGHGFIYRTEAELDNYKKVDNVKKNDFKVGDAVQIPMYNTVGTITKIGSASHLFSPTYTVEYFSPAVCSNVIGAFFEHEILPIESLPTGNNIEKGCNHDFVKYYGLFESYNFCKICDFKDK